MQLLRLVEGCKAFSTSVLSVSGASDDPMCVRVFAICVIVSRVCIDSRTPHLISRYGLRHVRASYSPISSQHAIFSRSDAVSQSLPVRGGGRAARCSLRSGAPTEAPLRSVTSERASRVSASRYSKGARQQHLV